MSHIFCIVHEHGGENFTDKYSESKLNNRDQFIMVSHGYAIWREFIADYMAYRINPLERPLSLTELRNIVRRLDDGVLDKRNPDWRQEVSQILANIFWTSKISAAQDIEIAFTLLEKNRIFHSKERCGDYREMIGLIFQQLERESVWEISFDFIKKLGCAEIWVRFDMKP